MSGVTSWRPEEPESVTFDLPHNIIDCDATCLIIRVYTQVPYRTGDASGNFGTSKENIWHFCSFRAHICCYEYTHTRTRIYVLDLFSLLFVLILGIGSCVRVCTPRVCLYGV